MVKRGMVAIVMDGGFYSEGNARTLHKTEKDDGCKAIEGVKKAALDWIVSEKMY
jgi:hypothetical protein